MPRRLLILGSTGSIGTQALDVVRAAPEGTFEIVGLAAGRQWEPLLAQAREHGVGVVALSDPGAAEAARQAWPEGRVLEGAQGLVELVLETDADVVLNALVGAAGLGPTVAALGEGIDLALANKESLVVGGELVMQLAEATGARVLPVDSEHSALWQLVEAERRGIPPTATEAGTIDRLVLTASGGPFRGRTRAELRDVGVEQALDHPTWAMGGKITIDSATLMNKGLEVIEAHHLFGTPYDRIDVVVHPQSIIHSYVTLCDGAALAHLGHPDMKAPIAFALHHPERRAIPMRPLDLAEVGQLTFERADEDTFRCLALAREAGREGGTAPCILNAANEIAVHAFLRGTVGFLAIAEIVEETLQRVDARPVHAFETLYAADRAARDAAGDLVAERAT